MGGAKSKQEEVNTEFVNHPKFNEVLIIERNNEKFIQLQLPVHAEREFRDWERSQKDLADCNKENLLLPQSFEFQKEGLCGSTGIVKILYENYPYLLTDEISNRKGLNKLFDESEIWYLLYTAVSAAKDFQKNKLKLGDVRPQNIFINEDGQVKLANTYSWPNEENNYMKTVLNNDVTYLAPEEVQELQNGKHENTCQPNLAEAFSIGLTIIDAGLLGDATSLYNLKSQKFDSEKAKELFSQWLGSEYSDFLKRTVLSLCELDPKSRSSPAEVYSKLQPYEDDIKNLKEFASSVQGSPNRPIGGIVGGAIQTGYPIQYRTAPYQYEGPALVKSQLVPEKPGEGYHLDSHVQPGTYIPGQVTTTYTNYTTNQATTYSNPPISGQPTSFTGPSGVTYTTGTFVKPFPTGNVSSGIATLNPPAYYTSAASAPVPYQFQYQPTSVAAGGNPTSNLPSTVNARTYEIPTSIQSGSTYTTSLPPLPNYTGTTFTGQPLSTYTAGTGTTGGVTYAGTTTYTSQPFYTSTTTTDNAYVPRQYVYNAPVESTQQTTQNAPSSVSGSQAGIQQSSSKSKLAPISTSGVGSGDNVTSKQDAYAPTTITRIVNGQPVTTTDVQRVESTSTDLASGTRKELSDARQVTSIEPQRRD